MIIETHKSNLSLLGGLFNPSKSPIEEKERKILFEKIIINSQKIEKNKLKFELKESEINVIMTYLKGINDPKARRFMSYIKNIKK